MTRPATSLEKNLREIRDAGRRSLAVYLTGGVPGFVELVRAAADGGADVIEAGIPWSDPVLDGPVIQQACRVALGTGVTPLEVLDSAAEADVPVPVVVMTYYNPVLRLGEGRFAAALADRGLAGAIVPDLPLEESAPWEEAASDAGVAAVLMAPPSCSDQRLSEICRRSAGFVYGMSLMGVTGVRQAVASTAARIGDRLRALTDRPVLLGIGISSGEQAAAAAAHADGVVVGSAVMRKVLDGGGPADVARFVAELRAALDGVPPGPP